MFSYLVVDISSTPDQQLEAKKALFYAAQACRVFLEPALDALWRVLPSLLPLLKLLPSFRVENDVGVSQEIGFPISLFPPHEPGSVLDSGGPTASPLGEIRSFRAPRTRPGSAAVENQIITICALPPSA